MLPLAFTVLLAAFLFVNRLPRGVAQHFAPPLLRVAMFIDRLVNQW